LRQRAHARPSARARSFRQTLKLRIASHRSVSRRTCATVSSNAVNAAPFGLTIYSCVIISSSVAVRRGMRPTWRRVAATSPIVESPNARAMVGAHARARDSRDGARRCARPESCSFVFSRTFMDDMFA